MAVKQLLDVALEHEHAALVLENDGDAERLDDVVFPLFPQGGGFPRTNDEKT